MSNFSDLLGNRSHREYLGRSWVIPHSEAAVERRPRPEKLAW